MTTGRVLLPVVLVVWLFLAATTLSGWDIANRLAAGIVSGYLLIELNTAYSLIRQRTTLHISLFLWLSAAAFTLPLSARELWATPLFLLAVHQLFATYESTRPQFGAFNAMICLSGGSFLFPPLAWLLPVWIIGLYQMRALTLRSFLAGLIGMIAPWWCYYGYAYCFHEAALHTGKLHQMLTLFTPDYTHLPVGVLLMGGVFLAAGLLSCLHYLIDSYKDKVRTRVHLSFLVFVQLLFLLAVVMQPAHAAVMLSLQLPLSALFVSHLFMLTHTRIISVYFLLFFILFLLLPFLSIWIV